MLSLPLASPIKLFADDSKLFNLSENHLLIQTDLHTINNWCKQNSMSINVDKTVFVRFGKSDCPSDYSIDGKSIAKVDTVKDLCIVVDRKLSFKDHCLNVVKKPSFLSYNVLRFFKFCDPKVKYFIFRTYVLAVIFYNRKFYYPTSKTILSRECAAALY